MIDRIVVPPDAKRDAEAARLAEQAHTWPVYTLKKPHGAFPKGASFFGIPSSDGGRYLVNSVVCECPDYRRRSVICKHIRAVLLLDKQNQTPVKKGYAELYPTCDASGCTDDPEPKESYCWRHTLVDAF